MENTHDMEGLISTGEGGAEPSGVQAGAQADVPGVSARDEKRPPWLEMGEDLRLAVVEALIFAAERPVTLRELRDILGAEREELLSVIERLRTDLSLERRGIVLKEVAGGLVFRTRADLAPWLRALVKSRPPRLSRAALECLAIIAYRQPVTRAEVEAVRGVESGSVLRTLLEKRLVRILGRKDDIGRPLIYGTTRDFLRMFGLRSLAELPTMGELSTLSGMEESAATGTAGRGERAGSRGD